jgi:hypothetical protein
MKTWIKNFATVALLVSSSSVWAQGTETRQLSSFEAVSVSGSFTVKLVKGNEESVKIEAKNVDPKDIITEISGGKLKIRYKDNNWGWKDNPKADIYVTFKKISGLSSSGSSLVELDSPLEGDRMNVSCSGSGTIKAKVDGKELEVENSGSGEIILKGKSEIADISSSGSGDIDAFELTSDEVVISSSGSCDVDVTAKKKLQVSISGSGDVRYKGTPEFNKVRVSGSGSVEKVD